MLPENIVLSVIDVLHFHQKKEKIFVPARSFSAMTLRLKAPGKYLINEKVYAFEPACICIVPEGVSYERHSNEDDLFVLHFNLMNYAMEEILIFKVEDAPKYEKLFRRALELKNAESAGYLYKITAVAYEIFSELIHDTGFDENPKDKRMIEAAEYMRQNFGDASLSIEEIAEKACITPAYFRREFKRIYRCSPKEYLDTLRIQYAKTLLEAGYFSQKEIAFRCGFSDVSYFRTAFRNKIGKSITHYLADPSRFNY